jgi:hypothetical protein
MIGLGGQELLLLGLPLVVGGVLLVLHFTGKLGTNRKTRDERDDEEGW